MLSLSFQRFYVNEALVIRKSPGSTESITVYLIDIVPNFSTFENSFPSADEVLQNTDKIAEVSKRRQVLLCIKTAVQFDLSSGGVALTKGRQCLRRIFDVQIILY